MSIKNFVTRATSYLSLQSSVEESHSRQRTCSSSTIGCFSNLEQSFTEQNEEIVYSKNNVCVRAREGSESAHSPGYFTIRSQEDVFLPESPNKIVNTTHMILSWVPNLAIKSHTQKVDQSSKSPFQSSCYLSKESNQINSYHSTPTKCKFNDIAQIEAKEAVNNTSSQIVTDSSLESSSKSSLLSLKSDSSGLENNQVAQTEVSSVNGLKTIGSENENKTVENGGKKDQLEVEVVFELGGGGGCGGEEVVYDFQTCVAREIAPPSFIVDIGRQVKSVRAFFSNDQKTCGQLVLCSWENQYKIFHFHHGGLDKVFRVLEEYYYSGLLEKSSSYIHLESTESEDTVTTDICQFSFDSSVGSTELHPEEGMYPMLDLDTWRQYVNSDGQIENYNHIRKIIFMAGMSSLIRKEVWLYLLHFYSDRLTHEQKEETMNEKYLAYQNIKQKRLNLSKDEASQFWKKVQCTVDKDVIRTDRSHPYFTNENNQNVLTMREILLNYAVFNTDLGYTQGMSDLLSPVLAELQNETEAFWCFDGLMSKTIFVCSPTDRDIDLNLKYLREMLKFFLPEFYDHFASQTDGLQLLFCHRWMLLCFKREFEPEEVLRIWETCWACSETKYFHLFLCVAVVALHGQPVIDKQFNMDGTLQHFTSLSMAMDGLRVLRKARSLLHDFRRLQEVPCSLRELCAVDEVGMWDSVNAPSVFCVCEDKSKCDKQPF